MPNPTTMPVLESSSPLPQAAYPHIFDLILSFSSREALLKLRATCRTVRDTCDAILSHHVRMSVTEVVCSIAPNSTCPSPHDHRPDHPPTYQHAVMFRDREGNMLVPSLTCGGAARARSLQLNDGSDYAYRSIGHCYTMLWPSTYNLDQIVILDILPLAALFIVGHGATKLARLHTVRYPAVTVYSVGYQNHPVASTVSNHIVFMDLNRQSSSVEETDPVLYASADVQRLVLTVRYDPEEPLINHWEEYEGSLQLCHIVLILQGQLGHDNPGVLDRLVNIINGLMHPALLVPYTIVGADPALEREIKSVVKTKLRRLRNSEHDTGIFKGLDVQQGLSKFRFFTLDEYRQTVGQEQFMLETVG